MNTFQGSYEAPQSCLSSDTFAHFSERERRLLAIDAELEKKKDDALLAATKASATTVDMAYRPLVVEETAAGLPVPAVSSATPANQIPASSFAPNPMKTTPYTQIPSSEHAPLFQSDSESMHTTVRFQKARIIALQDELDKTVALLSERDKERAEMDRDLKVAQEEARKLQRTQQNSTIVTDKLRKQLGHAELKIEDIETSNRELKKQVETLQQVLKKTEADQKTKDTRLVRVMDDLEKYKASVKELKTVERDRVSGDRKETDRLVNEVRKLERQRTELLNGFKKQNQLIDVLKKQKVHLEAARMLGFTEEEFIRVLELGDKVN